MGKINLSKVILGGLLAGVVVNISEFILNEKVMKAQWEETMKALGKTMPESGNTMAVWVVFGFVVGIAAVWLYAAIRPRFGPGPGTAAKAGVAVWFLGSLLSSIAMQNMGLFPLSMLVLAWTLVESIVATIAGAWVYKEA